MKYLSSAACFLKKEVVLSASLFLAAVSAFFVRPSSAYLSYIDFNTLFLLFSLMCVMAGFKKIGVFNLLGAFLLKKVASLKQLMLVLVMLPFFMSMLITNDVALITFVPFALIVLGLCRREGLLIPVIVLQTVAANLGSMLLPMGNPQNLYLYGVSGISLAGFIATMLPYTVISLLLIILCILWIDSREQSKSLSVTLSNAGVSSHLSAFSFVFYTVMFVVCLLTVAKVIPHRITALVVLASCLAIDRKILRDVDYSLLMTFVAFFVFIGNMGKISAFSSFVNSIIGGNEVLVAVLSSQVISNVPSALLLSGFTDNYRGLLVGTNLGGLGTLIASMASLISFKLLSQNHGELKKRYMVWFSAVNIAFLLVLLVMNLIISKF